MASTPEFAAFVLEQLSGAGDVTTRKMFGEYGFWCDGKFCAVACDNMLYIKPTKAGREALGEVVEAPPYEGAGNYFLIQDVEDRDRLARVLRATCDELPLPKKRKKKTEPAGQ